MEPKITEVAGRLRALRESENISQEDMAAAVGVDVEEYRNKESGTRDFTISFLHRCAEFLRVDITDIISGESPKLTGYTIVRKGEGLPMTRRDGFDYFLLSSRFKNKLMEPMLVFAPYSEDEQNVPIPLSKHNGQEFDYVLEGKMKFAYEKHVAVLNAGDSVFYDSGKGHGMIAADKDGCKFIAVILNRDVAP